MPRNRPFPPPWRAATLLAVLACPALVAQEPWSTEDLRARSEGFHAEGVLARYRQIGELVQHRDVAFDALCASIHGDHREYQLKIERLLDQLAEERWLAREDAERTLIEVGGRAIAQIEQRSLEGATLEERIRARRVLSAITARGTAEEEAEIRLLRGYVAAAAYFGPEPRLARALVSALGHTDPYVVEGALVALGRVGSDEHAKVLAAHLSRDPKGSALRQAALAALGRLPSEAALTVAEDLLLSSDEMLSRAEAVALLRDLWRRSDAAPLLGRLREHPDALLAALAGLDLEPGTGAGSLPARFHLSDRTMLEKPYRGLSGIGVFVEGPVEGLDVAEIAMHDCEVVEFDHPTDPTPAARLFLTQGTLLTGALQGIEGDTVVFRSPVFGEVRVARDDVQGIALDPSLDRLVGASIEHDRIRVKDRSTFDCTVVRMDAEGVHFETESGPGLLALAEVAGVLFRRPTQLPIDTEVYTRVDLVAGDRLLTHIGAAPADRLGLVVPGLGAAVVPMTRVARLEFGVGGGALWGFTLIADYSDNRIIEVDDQGREVFKLEEVYGAWDVECLDSGNLLVTEFALNRVVEVTREGVEVWSYENLKNPYDADRLPNGNTLIADTFGDRVIEVSPAGEIVWEYHDPGGIKPYDANRLPNGNTLIADGRKDRVIEVDRGGQIVWELSGMDSIHDADRLPNGNTLVTQRTLHRVIEVDRAGNIVFMIENLSSPSDADRLPNGHTIVAENGGVREFDRRGVQVWEKEVSWAVEVNKY